MRKTLLSLILLLVLACNLPSGSPSPVNPAPQGTMPPTSLVPAAAEATPTLVAIVEVPMSIIQIDGESYQAYQRPGDPFRFVCQQPCTADPNLIFAQYAGFHNAYEIMLKLTGVDILPELAPVDIHLTNNITCGKLGEVGALAFAKYYSPNNAVICMFIFEYAQGFNGQPYTPDIAVRLDQQTIFIHEYLHLVLMGRFPNVVDALHDFVTPLGLYIGNNLDDYVNPCTYHPETPPGDFRGRLFNNLCAQNGFRVDMLAPVMIELDNLYQSGLGQEQDANYKRPVPSVVQFRDILNRLLGSDTTKAFADACWPPELLGNVYSLSSACLIQPTVVTPTPVK